MNTAPAIIVMRDDLLNHIQASLLASSDADVIAFGNAVDKFPGDPKTYRPLNPVGAVLVFYRGSKRTEPLSNAPAPVLQQRQIDFDLTILSSNLQNQDTATKIVDAIDLAVTGFKPSWTDRSMWISKDGFVATKGGLWQYGILAHAKILSLQQGNP